MLNSGTEQRYSEPHKPSPASNTPAWCDLVLYTTDILGCVIVKDIWARSIFTCLRFLSLILGFSVFQLLPLQRTIEIPETRQKLVHQGC